MDIYLNHLENLLIKKNKNKNVIQIEFDEIHVELKNILK